VAGPGILRLVQNRTHRLGTEIAREHGIPLNDDAARAHAAKNFAVRPGQSRSIHRDHRSRRERRLSIAGGARSGRGAPNLTTALYARHNSCASRIEQRSALFFQRGNRSQACAVRALKDSVDDLALSRASQKGDVPLVYGPNCFCLRCVAIPVDIRRFAGR